MKHLLLLALTAVVAIAQQYPDEYNVIWTTPSKSSLGSMPLGNGDIGINAWVEEGGDFLFYIGKSDAWSETGRLLKLGRVRMRLSPNPFTAGTPFRQTLNIRTGEITIQAGAPSDEVKISLWVDANNPVVRVEAESRKNIEVQAFYERWRDQQRLLEGEEVGSAFGMENGPERLISYGDTIHQDGDSMVTWFHRNPKSIWGLTLKQQGLSELSTTFTDPLQNRTFGAAMDGDNFTRMNPTALRSKAASTRHVLQVYPYTAITNGSEEWVAQLHASISKVNSQAADGRRAAHEKWWQAFWERSYIKISGGEAQRKVSQAYALQRFLFACAGRGAYPIKSNGSLWTMDAKVGDHTFDPDYRKRGGAYSFQRTRFAYWPLLASGDSEFMQPLIKMYMDGLVAAQKRSKLYFNHGGLFFPETVYFWNTYPGSSYGWDRQNKPLSHIEDPATRHAFAQNIELLLMLMEFGSYRDDTAFKRTYLATLTEDVLTFFDAHYERDIDSRLRISPAQAGSAYLEAVNPMPEIAGLRYVIEQITEQKIPVSNKGAALAKKIQQQLPPIPTTAGKSGQILAPAERVSGEFKGTDNPELTAVFPFRVYGMEKQDLELARRTFMARKAQQASSVDAVQAAFLGLSDVAKDLVVKSFTQNDPEIRFPAFWSAETELDWAPDQGRGGAAMLALQSMLLQANGAQLLLGPAWPKDWDVEFKLFGPQNTAVEGAIRGGKAEKLRTAPGSRLSSIKRYDQE